MGLQKILNIAVSRYYKAVAAAPAKATKKEQAPENTVKAEEEQVIRAEITQLEQEVSYKFRDPKLAAYLELASLYLSLGEFEKAEEATQKILNFDLALTNARPTFYDEAVFLLADIYRLKTATYSESKYLDKALEILTKGLNQLGNLETGYKRRYYLELLKTCTAYQAHFGRLPENYSSFDVSSFYLSAADTLNNNGPGHADNFIAARAFITYGDYHLAAGNYDKANEVFDKVNQLVRVLRSGSDDLMDNVVMEFSKQTGSKQTDLKNFRLFQALAYKGMAEAEKRKAYQAGSNKTKQSYFKNALLYYKRALEFAGELKNDFPMEFYRGAMYEERQAYYDIVADYAETNLHLFHASKDKKYLGKAQKLAEEVIALYKEYDYDKTNFPHLKALFVLAGVLEINKDTAPQALETYEAISIQTGVLEKKQTLTPYLLYLKGKALIGQGHIKGNKKEYIPAINLMKTGRKCIRQAQEKPQKGSGLESEFKRLTAESYAKEASLYFSLADKAAGKKKQEYLAKAKKAAAKLPKDAKHLLAQVKVKEIEFFVANCHKQIGSKDFADKTQKAFEELDQARKKLTKEDEYSLDLIPLLQGKLMANLIIHYKRLNAPVDYAALIGSAKTLLDRVSDNYSQPYMEAIIEKNSIIMQNPDICDVLTEFELDLVSDAIGYAKQIQDYALRAQGLLIRGEYFIVVANNLNHDEAYSFFLLAKEDLAAAKDIADPGSFTEAKAGILYASILTRYPELADKHELAAMVFPAPGTKGLNNYQERVGKNTYLWQLGQLAKGNILSELSLFKQAYEELALVKDYDELKAQAYIKRASAISQDPKAFNVTEVRQSLKELEQAQTDYLLADSYLDLLSQALQGELYLVLANKTKKKSDKNTALAYLENVPKEIPFLYHGARVSIVSIKTRNTNNLNSTELANYETELRAAIDSKEVKDYRLYLAHLCLARVYLAQGKLTEAREQIAKVSEEHEALYAEACILDGVVLNKDIKLAKDKTEVRLVQKRIYDNRKYLEKDSYLEKYAIIIQGELLFNIEGYASAQIVFENEELDLYPAMRGQALVRLAQIELKVGWKLGETEADRKSRATEVLRFCEQAKTMFIDAKLKSDDYRMLEVDLLTASTLIMRNDKNDPAEAIKTANKIIETVETSKLKPEEKTSFIMQAKLKKAEALIQGRKILEKSMRKKSAKLVEEALVLLLEIEDSLFENRIIGVDPHSFNAELYHQIAIAYAIKGLGLNFYNYAELACQEAKASSNEYDQAERLDNIRDLMIEIPEESNCK